MRPSRRQTVAHLVTDEGEIVDVVQDRPPGRSFGRRFVVLFEDTLRRLASSLTNATTWRVLARLPDHLEWEAWRRLPQRMLAQELRMSVGAVSEAMNQLVELGVVERRGRGPVTEWRLTTELGWRGNVESFHAERRRRGAGAPKPALEQLPQKGYYGKWEGMPTGRSEPGVPA